MNEMNQSFFLSKKINKNPSQKMEWNYRHSTNDSRGHPLVLVGIGIFSVELTLFAVNRIERTTAIQSLISKLNLD
jgi:hypothetical protein